LQILNLAQSKGYVLILQIFSRNYPSCSIKEADIIAEHACQKYSGRVGRSLGAKGLEQKPIERVYPILESRLRQYQKHHSSKHNANLRSDSHLSVPSEHLIT
jgi:hypothetical protein